MFTHYMPAHWKNRLHSNEVRAEFSALYQMKILIFVEEILSLIVAPLVLLRNATHRCERVIDFFREHTVHVEGIGYQCNFAVFRFKKDMNAEDPMAVLGEADGLRDDYYGLKDDKLAASRLTFENVYHNTRLRQPFNFPPHWPSHLTSDPIAEEPSAGSSAAHYYPGPRTAANRRSAILDTRSQRFPVSMRSPPQASLASNVRKPRPEQSQDIKPSTSGHGITESTMMAKDSDLYDYTVQAGKEEEMMESDGEENEIAGGNAGVLGMLQQFAKAHTEKGAGVTI